MSSLAGLPIRQGIAVTGSVNQLGEIQPVGGVTHKVEGFFDTCTAAAGGLTGDQGVIIPASNAANLMLRDDVVDAVAAGRFHVWTVRTVDEGIELLTGVPAGERGADGRYPPDSVNGRVDRKLYDLADKLNKFGQPPKDDGGHKASRAAEEAEEEAPEPAPPEPELPGEEPEGAALAVCA